LGESSYQRIFFFVLVGTFLSVIAVGLLGPAVAADDKTVQDEEAVTENVSDRSLLTYGTNQGNFTTIQAAGLVDAVGDWRNDRISTLDLFEVVNLFRSERKLLNVEFEEQESPGGERVTVSTASIVGTDRLDPPDEFIIAVENESGAVLSESKPVPGSGAGIPVESLGIQFDIGEQVNLTATLYRVENGSRGAPFQIGAGGQVPAPIEQTTVVSPLAEPVLSDLDIAGQGSDATVVAGQAENVSVNVTNTGDQTRSFAVELRVGSGDQPTNTRSTAPLAPGETGTVVFGNVTGGLERGDYNLRVGDSQGVSEVTGTASIQFGNVDRVELTPPGTETIVAGEILDVSATAFDASGNVLETNDSAFSWDAGNGSISGAGVFDETTAASYDVTAALGGVTSSATTVIVNEPANFDVRITGVDSAVTAGETVTVAYEVTNTGDLQGTQNIRFAVNGTTEATESGLGLNGSETFSGQFTYDTVVGDSPAVSVNVSSENSSVTETVTVNEPANFDVRITSVDSAVAVGETVTVAYELTNTGDVRATQDIRFAVNGTTEATESGLGLNGSETFSGQFTYATSSGDTPAVSVSVSSNDDSVTETVTVSEPANFDVIITSVDSAVTAGETVTVAYEVTNTGDVRATQDIRFAVNGTTEDTESGVTLDGSETFSGQFTYVTGDADTPAVSVNVSSNDDSVTETVTVEQPATSALSALEVAEQGETATILEGNNESVAATVTNVGDQAGTFTLDLTITNGTQQTDSQGTGKLAPGETRTVLFENVTGGLASDTYDVVVETGNSSLTGNLTVDAIESTVEFDNTPDGASRGDNLSNDVTVNVSLQRVGPSVAEPVTVTLVFEGLTRAGESETVLGTETVQVERGNTTRVVFDSLSGIPPSAIATDDEPVTLRAETGDDTATREIDISNSVADAAAEAVGGSEVVTVLGAIDVGGESVELASGLEGLTLEGFDASARLFSGDTTLPGPGTSGLLELRADNVTVRNLDLGLGGSVTGGLPVVDIVADNTTVDNVTATRNATGTDDQFTQVVRIGENTTGSTVTASTLGGQGAALNAIVTDDAGDATVTGNVLQGDADIGLTLAGNGSTVEANNFSAVGGTVDAYVFDFEQAADLSAIGGTNSFGPAASLTSVDFQTGGVRVNGSSLVPGPGPTRSLNTTQVEPGGTVEVTVTAALDSVADVSLADKWSPDFNSTELVDVSFSTNLELVTGGDVIVQGDDVAAGELTIVYRVSVSDSATVGTTYEWSEFPDSAMRINGTDFGIVGDDTVEVVSNSG
jgi:hypothetical protein